MLVLKRQWTLDDLDDLPDNDGNRYEIIDGELFVTPAPAWTHQAAVGELYRLLNEYVVRHRVGYALVAPADVIFSPRRVVEPDIFVVPPASGRRPKSFAEAGKLLLAAEVLSPSTARADRTTKRALFRDEGVAEYWIVDLDARVVERSTPEESRPEILSERLEWTAEGATESLVIDLTDYFARVLDE